MRIHLGKEDVDRLIGQIPEETQLEIAKGVFAYNGLVEEEGTFDDWPRLKSAEVILDAEG